MHKKISSAKCRPFYPGEVELSEACLGGAMYNSSLLKFNDFFFKYIHINTAIYS